MSEINRVTAVTPGSLVAMALLCHGRRGLPHVELVDHCARLATLVRGSARAPRRRSRGAGRRAARGVDPRGGARSTCAAAWCASTCPATRSPAARKKRARIYTGDDVIYTVPDEQRLILDLSKNIIIHLFVDRALVSVALLALAGDRSGRRPVARRLARAGAVALAPLQAGVHVPRRRALRADLRRDARRHDRSWASSPRTAITLGFGPGHDGLDGRGWVDLLRRGGAELHRGLPGRRARGAGAHRGRAPAEGARRARRSASASRCSSAARSSGARR